MSSRRSSIALRAGVVAALLATAPRAQSTQTSQGWYTEALDLEYLWALSYVSALDAYAYVPAAVPEGSLSTGPSPADIAAYLYSNGARALTVPAPGQPGSEMFSNGARALTVPAPGRPGSEVFSNGARLLTVPPPGQPGSELFSNGARVLTVPSPGQPGSELFSNGARVLTVPPAGQPGSEVFSNGARLLTVPPPGQPGSELFTSGARVLTVPNPSFPPSAPSASSAAASAPSVSPSAPSAVAPPPEASAVPAPPLVQASPPTAASPSASSTAVSPDEALAPAVPLATGRGLVSPDFAGSRAARVPVASRHGDAGGPAPAGASSPEESTGAPTVTDLRLANGAPSRGGALRSAFATIGGMARALAIGAITLFVSLVTVYALSLGLKRRFGRRPRS
ncbi:MAG TPA: hypothetical protein VF395_18290 [Polyangiaceae bacterium]